MSVDKKVPEIRFKGFSEKWKKKELGKDVADIIGGGTPSTLISEFWDGDIDWYSPTEIGSRVYAEGSHKKITLLGLKSSSAKILPAGKTVLFTSRAGIGDMAILTKPGATNQGFQSFIVKEGFSPYFIYSVGKQIKEFALKHASGSTFLEISGKQLGRMKILMPILEEQTTIGNYFQKLDTLINQHQKKHDKLCNIKKAMLEKMFPKQGKTIPEIRFKGFSDGWKETKLFNEAIVTTGFPFDSADFSSLGTFLVITNGNIQNDSAIVDGKTGNRIAANKISSLSQYILNIGDILVTMDGTVGRTAKVIDTHQILAQRVGRLVAKHNNEFLYQSLNTGVFLETMTTISHGGTIKHISLSEISNYVFFIPKSLEEQVKIGCFLKQLDNLIAQHQQQITKLNNIKQACLSKMFV